MTTASIFGWAYTVIFIGLGIAIILGEFKLTKFMPLSAMFRRALAHRTGRLALWMAWSWEGYHMLVAVIPH